MRLHRRSFLRLAIGGFLGTQAGGLLSAAEPARRQPPLKITGLKITPIALPDPPILAAGGCHGPYFLRNLVQVETDGGIVGIGETRGGLKVTEALEKARDMVMGQNAFAFRKFFRETFALNPAAYAGIELACLDACGKATGRRLCELLGGPVRDEVELAAYLFYRYAADHPRLLADPRIVDARGKGAKALDQWGEVRTPEAMVREATEFNKRWGFRTLKLKAGVLPPEVEQETMIALNAHFKGQAPLRIDPNGRWKVETAIQVGKKLADVRLEYYEDPVVSQKAMAEVRKVTALPMSTNMCVTRFEHFPDAVQLKPVDVVLADNHYWGGLIGCQELGRICQTFVLGVSQHSNNHAGPTLAAMVHLAAVVPQLTFATDTHYPWLPENMDVIEGANLKIENGRMPVPTEPGLGVRLDADKVARANEVYRKSGIKERDDAFTMRLVEPGWERKLF